jgi:hypothetical protein
MGKKHPWIYKMIRTRNTVNMVGKNHWNWKGGITSENQKIRDSEEYKNWRLQVYRRDNYICKRCNIKSKKINAHHIENFTKEEYRFSIENGVTLCEKCHKLFHHIYRRKNNNIEQFIEFLGNN